MTKRLFIVSVLTCALLLAAPLLADTTDGNQPTPTAVVAPEAPAGLPDTISQRLKQYEQTAKQLDQKITETAQQLDAYRQQRLQLAGAISALSSLKPLPGN